MTMSSMGGDALSSLDRDFVRRACERSGGSLDVEVPGEEIGQELGLDERQTLEVVARLTRTGFLRDVGSHQRVKITIRSLALAAREG
jgi:DNA-binding IclR family transcriptional regulator